MQVIAQWRDRCHPHPKKPGGPRAEVGGSGAAGIIPACMWGIFFIAH